MSVSAMQMRWSAKQLAAALGVALCPVAALAQARQEPEPRSDIVVTGQRGSAITSIAPVATFDSDAIAAIGAPSLPELLRTIRGTTQAADGSEPIFLIDGQRVSGYNEVATLPPEAIAKVEVLPEAAALRFGFPPTRRVVNFITKPRFRQAEAIASNGVPTRGGNAAQKLNAGLTRLRDGTRLTLSAEYRHTSPIFQSERDVAPDPGVPFDPLGNIFAVNGGEIDPALSAAAGRTVTVAPVPLDAGSRTLAGFAAGAGMARLYDFGAERTLVPANDAVKGGLVYARRIGGTLSGSISLSGEQVLDRAVLGPADAILLVPPGNPASPFNRPVLLYRFLTEAPSMHQRTRVTTLNAGATLRGAIAGWRWDLTATIDRKQTDRDTERGIDVSAANAAIAAGRDPFAPLDPALLGTVLRSRERIRVQNSSFKTVIAGSPFNLPAGKTTLTATIEAESGGASSRDRSGSGSALRLARARIEGGVAIDLPITSRDRKVLGAIGTLSLNGSLNVRSLRGFGTLHDSTLGATWSPARPIQFLLMQRHSATAPDISTQATPRTVTPNVPFLDYRTGTTEIISLIQSGNPGLRAERKATRSLGFTLQPIPGSALRLSATYEATTLRDQTGNIYASGALIEAAAPGLFVRNAQGRLIEATLRPINFALERQRMLNILVNANGQVGKPKPAPAGGKPPPRWNYWAGTGPSIKFLDQLILTRGAPVLDLLAGDSVNGGGTARISGYAYGGASKGGNGFTFDFWASGASHVRGGAPTTTLRFGTVFKLNLAAFASLHEILPKADWAKRTQIRIEVANATDWHPGVTDATGSVPSRFQRDLMEPTGRTITLALRKRF